MSTLAVICKEPLPGRVKTRLSPPWSPQEAAALAEAALRDTFDAVRATPCGRRVAVLDGAPGPWLGDGIEVVAQRGTGLGERLAAAFADLGGPTVVIGMDTPQVTPALLEQALRATVACGAALGPAADGGYWAIGLDRADPRVFDGVPMSSARTGARQRARLVHCGFAPATLPVLVDVDDARSARTAALAAPAGHFAHAMRALDAAVVAA